MRRLDVMDEIRQVGELDPALVELAHIQQEYGHLALSLTRSATCVCVCVYMAAQLYYAMHPATMPSSSTTTD